MNNDIAEKIINLNHKLVVKYKKELDDLRLTYPSIRPKNINSNNKEYEVYDAPLKTMIDDDNYTLKGGLQAWVNWKVLNSAFGEEGEIFPIKGPFNQDNPSGKLKMLCISGKYTKWDICPLAENLILMMLPISSARGDYRVVNDFNIIKNIFIEATQNEED